MLGNPLASGALAIGNLFGQRIIDKAMARHSERVEEVARELAVRLALAESPERQVEVLDDYLQDSNRADAIVASFQNMLDAVSAASWPCIAGLTAEYVGDRRPTDGFYRDAVAVLMNLDPEGLAAAEAVLAKGLEEPDYPLGQPGVHLTVNYNGPPRSEFTFTSPAKMEGKQYFSSAPPGVPRALRILAAQGFGDARAEQITLNGENAERCRRLLRYLRMREGRASK